MIGTTITNDHSTGMWVTVMTPTATYPATTARSPWARLTTFMTPNISDNPQANSAYRPPVRIPWMMALTQAIPPRSLRRRRWRRDRDRRPARAGRRREQAGHRPPRRSLHRLQLARLRLARLQLGRLRARSR